MRFLRSCNLSFYTSWMCPRQSYKAYKFERQSDCRMIIGLFRWIFSFAVKDLVGCLCSSSSSLAIQLNSAFTRIIHQSMYTVYYPSNQFANVRCMDLIEWHQTRQHAGYRSSLFIETFCKYESRRLCNGVSLMKGIRRRWASSERMILHATNSVERVLLGNIHVVLLSHGR
jgi:hypothetical protein